MATFTGQLISATYDAILKTVDNDPIGAAAKQITDGLGNVTPLYISTTQIGIGITPTEVLHVSGNIKATGTLTIDSDATIDGNISFDSLTGIGVAVTINKFVSQADGIASNDNDTTLPTSAAVKDYVDTKAALTDTLEEVLALGNTTGGTNISITAGDKITTFESTGIDDNATSTALTIDSSQNSSFTGTVTAPTFIGNLTGNVAGNITGTVNATSILADGVTATTQSALNGSTKVATTAYADAAASAVPIGDYLPLVGGTLTGDVTFDDDVIVSGNITLVDKTTSEVGSILLGNSNALQIFYDGSNSFVSDSGTGDLYVRSNSTAIIKSDITKIQAFGSSTDFVTINSTGATFAGTVTAAQYYKSSTAYNVIGTGSSGEVILRPAAWNLSTAQSSFTTTLATIGTDATFAGDVGIGTDNPSGYGSKLVVNDSGTGLYINNDGGTATIKIADAGVAEYSITLPDGTGDFAISKGSSERMVIDSSGNVTINEGTLNLGTNSSKTGTVYFWSSANDSRMSVGNTGSSFEFKSTYLSSAGYKPIEFYTSDLKRLTIEPNGTIQAIRGDAGDLFYANSTSSAGSGIINYNSSLTSASNNTSCSHFKGTTQNVASYHLYGNGSSSWSSDSRLKRDIKTTRDGYIDDINKLRVVKYKWKNDENSGLELGLIAQEVEKIFPSLVVDTEDAVGNGETYKSLKYSVLPTILLKGMQEQQKMIQELKAEVDLLKSNKCNCK